MSILESLGNIVITPKKEFVVARPLQTLDDLEGTILWGNVLKAISNLDDWMTASKGTINTI